MSQFQTDLTQGSVFGQLLKFSVPFLLSNLLQALYNMADMVIVGQFGGAVGASAVGIGGQVTILIINLISGLAVGGTRRWNAPSAPCSLCTPLRARPSP